MENEIKKIPGQTTGISLDYFLMLAGDDTHIKMDRMMNRFLMTSIGEIPTKHKARTLIIDAVKILKNKYPNLTPKMLDHQIWLYQRNLKTR